MPMISIQVNPEACISYGRCNPSSYYFSILSSLCLCLTSLLDVQHSPSASGADRQLKPVMPITHDTTQSFFLAFFMRAGWSSDI